MTTLPKKLCSVDGCGRRHVARGFCDAHYRRWNRGTDVTTPIGAPGVPGGKCSVPGCKRRHAAKGYCHLHYERWKTGTSLTAPLRAVIAVGAKCSVEWCKRPEQARGYCGKHHRRWRQGKDPSVPTSYEMTPDERFWRYVNKRGPNDCWLWTGSTDKNGYGRLRHNGRQRGAHRFSYELHLGRIPKGLFVCHECDTPGCVNPAHLWLGTPANNATDRDRKGRHWAPRGNEHPTAKLTEAQVQAIRRLYRTGKYTQAELGEQFGVTNTAVQLLVSRKTWGHVS